MAELHSPPEACSPTRKRMGSHVKEYLETWYQSMNRPKMISQAQKDEVLLRIQTDSVEPAGIGPGQLQRWLSQRRRKEKGTTSMGKPTSTDPTVPRPKLTGLRILFPTFTDPELRYLQVLVDETPDPSLDLISMWSESPSLPNVTTMDAIRFVKYNLARSRHEHVSISTSPSTSNRPLYPEDAECLSEEEDMLQDDSDSFDQTHLPTPTTSTSPEPNSQFLKADPDLSPKIPYKRLSAPSVQSPPDARSIIEVLRTQYTPTEIQKLLLGNDLFPTTVSSTHATKPRMPSHVPMSSNISPNDVFEELENTFRQRIIGEPMVPNRFVDLLESCEEKSDKFLVALQGGELKQFGLMPSIEPEVHAKMTKEPLALEGTTRPHEPP